MFRVYFMILSIFCIWLMKWVLFVFLGLFSSSDTLEDRGVILVLKSLKIIQLPNYSSVNYAGPVNNQTTALTPTPPNFSTLWL